MEEFYDKKFMKKKIEIFFVFNFQFSIFLTMKYKNKSEISKSIDQQTFLYISNPLHHVIFASFAWIKREIFLEI